MPWTEAIPYFSKDELACKHCGEVRLDYNLALHLPLLRHQWGRPLNPTSVCRCGEHNDKVGGHPRSLHLIENPVHDTDGCLAVDIGWAAWTEEQKLHFARVAWMLGWAIGLNNSFIHLDRRSSIGLTRRVFTYARYAGEFDALDVTGEER